MVTSTKTGTRQTTGPGGRVPGPNGNKAGGNGWHGGDRSEAKRTAAGYRIAMWMVLAAIVMMFAALSSTYIVLSSGETRQAIRVPFMFFVSSGMIVISSWTLEKAKSYLSWQQMVSHARWLSFTLILGFGFLGSQLLGWRELARGGVYFVGNPDSTFFYLFTAAHGVHLIGGICLLVYLLLRGRKKGTQDIDMDTTWSVIVSRYWHAMGLLWLWLFILLLVFG